MDFEKTVYDFLDLPDVKITQIITEKNEVHIYLESSQEPQCPLCNSTNVELKDVTVRENIRDRNIMYKKCFLHITIRVVKCHDCKKGGREHFDFLEPYAYQTKRYKEYISQLGFELNFSSISTLEEIGLKTVEKILNDYVYNHSKNSLQGAVRLGIDEFSFRKGHKHFSTIIANNATGKPLSVLPNREERELRRYFKSIPEKERENIIEISMDMWSTFIKVAEECFPNSKITIDRFHVMQHVNKIVDKIRTQEYKKLHDDQKKKIKNIQWIMRKNSYTLIDEEKNKLKLFFSWSKKSKKAYMLKEEFVHIMDKITDVKKGKKQLEIWIKKIKKLKTKKAISFAKTATKLLDYISNYFAYNTTNGVMEGIMNKVKAIKRIAFGIPNPYHMANRIFLAFMPKKSLYSTVNS